ncbi:MAG: hypothetical protein HQM12_23865 [SAR324 cluster bacterium]|nr:hypothetical protein [SAR324 cluster bacterium]
MNIANHDFQLLIDQMVVFPFKNTKMIIGTIVCFFWVIGCGVVNEPLLEFEIIEPVQDAEMSSVTTTIVVSEIGGNCDATDVKTFLIITLQDGSEMKQKVELGEVERETSVSKELSIQTNGVQAISSKTEDSTYKTGYCGNTQLGI